jgi:WD40 repeat protein
VKLWQFQDRAHRNFIAHPQTVASVAWHPAGDRYVTGGADGTAKLWWLEETEPRWVVQHGTSVRDLTISPTGTELLTGGEDGTIQRWNLETGQLLATLNAHRQPVTAVAFVPQTSEFVTASEDGTAIWWDENGQPVAEFAHEDRVVGVAFSPQGEVLATASSDRAIRLWNRQGALLTTLFHDEHIPTDLAWNDSGTRLAVATKERAIVVWEIALDAAENLTSTPKILRHLWGHHAEVTQLDYVGDSLGARSLAPCDGAGSHRLLVSASRDRTLRLWDEPSERETVFDRHSEWVTAAAFSPDGRQLISGDRSGRAILWRVLQPQVETSIQQGCDWISDYLRYSDEAEADLQEMCNVTGDVENL